MSKKPVTTRPLKDNGKPLVNSDDEAITIAESLSSEVEDLVETIRERGWQEALETLESVIEGVEALHPYLHDKE